MGYHALFPLAAVCSLIGAVLIVFIKSVKLTYLFIPLPSITNERRGWAIVLRCVQSLRSFICLILWNGRGMLYVK